MKACIKLGALNGVLKGQGGISNFIAHKTEQKNLVSADRQKALNRETKKIKPYIKRDKSNLILCALTEFIHEMS